MTKTVCIALILLALVAGKHGISILICAVCKTYIQFPAMYVQYISRSSPSWAPCPILGLLAAALGHLVASWLFPLRVAYRLAVDMTR